jgi:TatD DNase family protein
MLIDTHCHLDASEFDNDRDQVLQEAIAAGIGMIVIPAVAPFNFEPVQALSNRNANCCYALGIHPLYIQNAYPSDIEALNQRVARLLQEDDKLVAIGEIGLDYFVYSREAEKQRELQEYFFSEQLKIAREYDLPVILHVRRAVDDVLKHLRRIRVSGGIAHAFNGSAQQAEEFIKLGFKLGFGGAMTYPRALKIRELAKNLPLEAIVLETDAPDIPPEWLGSKGRNSPKELLQIAQNLALIRGIPLSQLLEITNKNSMEILPKMADLYTRLEVLH